MKLTNGYIKLPRGQIANSVTWLELTDLSQKHALAPVGFSLQRLALQGLVLQGLALDDATLYRQLYRMIGTPWLWAGMLSKSEADMAAYLTRDSGMSFVVFNGGKPAGILDLEVTAADGSESGVEVVNFGFIPESTGQGAGAWLMSEAVRIAAEQGAKRLWLHTCNFDHPRAVAFYQRQGFRIYAQGIEIMDDPRHSGLLPKDAAPHVPMIPEKD